MANPVMVDLWGFVVILLALLIGFFIGRKVDSKKHHSATPSPWIQERYIEGLSYLLNEQTDEAVDYFIARMAVNTETLEIHLSLGNLLRKKGEIARAVKVHQNLLTRPSLTKSQLHLAQFELAKDYVSSGLLDRAEILLGELIDQNQIDKELRRAALVILIDVYQDTRDWLKAIDIADRLTTRKFTSHVDKWRQTQAHYSCELAESAKQKKDWMQARKWINAALRYDKNCVRASLLDAQLNIDDENYVTAIASLKRISSQNPCFASEMISPLYQCYQQLNLTDELKSELLAYLKNNYDFVALNYLSELIVVDEDYQVWLDIIADVVSRFPKMDATRQLIDVISNHKKELATIGVHFKPVLDKLLTPDVKYQCVKCGFEGSHIHWLCPSCKSWESIHMIV